MLHENKIPEESGYYWCKWRTSSNWEMCRLLSPCDDGTIEQTVLIDEEREEWVPNDENDCQWWQLRGNSSIRTEGPVQWIGPLPSPGNFGRGVTVYPSAMLAEQAKRNGCVVHVEAIIDGGTSCVVVGTPRRGSVKIPRESAADIARRTGIIVAGHDPLEGMMGG